MIGNYIKINPLDNVAVAISPLNKGTTVRVDNLEIELQDSIPAGHKFLLSSLPEGSEIVKYGYPIGHLTQSLKQGSLVDHNNLKTNLSGLLSYEYSPVYSSEDLSNHTDCRVDYNSSGLPDHFMGYRRSDGSVGIRNCLWVIPTVGCVNGVVNEIVSELKTSLDFDNHASHPTGITQIVGYNHNYGCSQLGDDHETTRKILRDMVLHPNAGAVLVVGLGCENNQPKLFEEFLGDYDKRRIRFLTCQDYDGNEVDTGVEICKELFEIAGGDHREAVPLSELRVGLKCGGSDGFSGITGNPLLGVFNDYLVSQGGTTVLTEVPEMFGAETILMNRCVNRELFDQTVDLINNFKEYFLSHGEPVGENPSPGNKAGGISTLEEKALGCTQKCGRSAVRGVMSYGDRLSSKGLNLLSAPGNDLVASTALASSGCHIVLFTTGRGTPFGTFVPTMKVSTNSNLYNKKPHWIDFNAGPLVEGVGMEDLFREFTKRIIAIANGEQTWNEKKGYEEFAIFKNGITL